MQGLSILLLSFLAGICVTAIAQLIANLLSYEYKTVRQKSRIGAELKASVISLCYFWDMSKCKDIRCDLRKHITDSIKDMIVPLVAYYENERKTSGELCKLCTELIGLCSTYNDLDSKEWSEKVEVEADRICKLFKAEIRKIR